jgi:hypothetical protein
MANGEFENIYRFEITTKLRPLVTSAADPGAAEMPGGRRYYLSYVDGKVASPGLDGAAVGKGAQAVLEHAFGKKLASLTEAEAHGLGGCQDPTLRQAIESEIQAARAGDLCASVQGLQQFLGRFASAAELRRARGPLTRRLIEAGDLDVGLEGEIITSGDWASLREDGVYCLDSRFTIQAVDGTLISCQLQGRADIRRAMGGGGDLEAYRRWEHGHLEGDRLALPLHAQLRFEVSGDPGEKAEFAAARWLRAGGCFWKYQHLGRGLFLGAGALQLDRRNGQIQAGYATGLRLSVHEVHGRVLSRLQVQDQRDDDRAA